MSLTGSHWSWEPPAHMRHVALGVGLLLIAAPALAQVPDHLRCYRIKDSAPRASYTADLVPGVPQLPAEPGCRIKVPATMLCTNASKTNVVPAPPGAPGGIPTGRFVCYKARCERPDVTVAVTDQFGSRTVAVKKGTILCAPATVATTTTIVSSATTTTTLPTGSGVVRFALLGNTGEGNANQTAVATALDVKCEASGCDFVQLLGSNIFDTGVDSTSDPQWQVKFEIPYQNVALPFYAVLGNHDYGGDGAGYELDRAQHQVDYTAVSTKFRMPSHYYHHTVEHVEFFALDTTPLMFGPQAQQQADVTAWLAASTATWKIAFGHHVYRSNGPHGNAGNYDGLPFPPGNGANVRDFVEDVLCGQADVYFSASDRSLQVLEPTCQGTELVVSGSGSKLTTIEAPPLNPVRFASATLGFVYVVIDGQTLTLDVIDSSGATLFSRSITKP